MAVADICDRHRDKRDSGALQVASSDLLSFGGKKSVAGRVVTVKIGIDPTGLKELLAEPGNGRIAVADTGGNLANAVFGEKMARLALDNSWAAVVVNGVVRDTMELSRLALGVWALGRCPARSFQHVEAQRNVALSFAGITVEPGCFLYADEDGLIVSTDALEP